MIKNFNQFNDSVRGIHEPFKEKIELFKRDIVLEMKRDLDPILKLSHEVNDILSEYDDLGYSDYKIRGFDVCFATIDKPNCLNFDIDLEKDEIVIGGNFVDEHGVDKLETFFSKLELLTAGIFIEFNSGVHSSNLKWDKGTLQKLKLEIEGRWNYSNFIYLGPGVSGQFNSVLSVKIKDLL